MKMIPQEMQAIFHLKYGDLERTGWGPRMRLRFKYFTPDDIYESLVAEHVSKGCRWIDVGGGRHLFPDNKALAKLLAERCNCLIGVDPSDNIDENSFVHVKIKSVIETYYPNQTFDLATLRMVAEHMVQPELVVDALRRLLRPGGKVIIYTVNRWSPLSVLSAATPMGLHHFFKRILWKTEEEDSFPVVYKMNTRKCLLKLFQKRGFRECDFAYLDDCRTFARFRSLSYLELLVWRCLKAAGLRYPETCLLGIYERL